MNLISVPKDQIDEWWLIVRPLTVSFFERAGGRYDEQDVIDRLKTGQFLLWVAMEGHIIKAACMSNIIRFPKLNDMRIFMTVGEEYEGWIGFIRKLEDFARDMGCAKLTGEARPGWEKILKPDGYNKTHVFLEKDL